LLPAEPPAAIVRLAVNAKGSSAVALGIRALKFRNLAISAHRSDGRR
jgi:hypothetical protein